MGPQTVVSEDWLQARLAEVLGHPRAPKWNFSCSDQLTPSDAIPLRMLGQKMQMYADRKTADLPFLPDWLLSWLLEKREVTPALQERIPVGFGVLTHWMDLPTSSRGDLVAHLAQWVAEDVSYDQMMIYGSSGTTGTPLLIPKTPYAVARYQLALQCAFWAYGIDLTFHAGTVGNALLCAQRNTIMYAAPLSTWGSSIHMKVNLHDNAWRHPSDRIAFLTEYDPPVLTGDPISFAELLRLAIPLRPKVFVSTALQMSSSLKNALTDRYGCPVIDFYAMNETGPIAFACPNDQGFHVCMPDLFVEVLDDLGVPVGEEECGEVTVTGGGNDFLPLLRYRTGDRAQYVTGRCICGSHLPRLYGLQGRKAVPLFHKNGTLVNEVDVSKIIRYWPVVAFSLYQNQHLDVQISIRWLEHPPADVSGLVSELAVLFGGVRVTLHEDKKIGQERKPLPFNSWYEDVPRSS